MHGNDTLFRQFFNERKVYKFSKIIFVSNESKIDFMDYYPALSYKCLVCNNLVDYNQILDLSSENIDEEKSSSKILLNVGRHDEHQKKLSRLINVCKRLVSDGFNFKLWLIGDGPDHKQYLDQIEELGLQEYIQVLVPKSNPYPYYKNADAFVMTSDYEGFPVVYVESMTFGLPIITTIPVSDDSLNINNYAMIVEKDEESIYNAVKQFLCNGFTIKEKFNPEEFNRNILSKLEKLFDGVNL